MNKTTAPVTTPRKSKLYKGDIMMASELVDLIQKATPVQPIDRKVAFGGELPPTFVVTKLVPMKWGPTIQMHYYDPKTKLKTLREIPKDFKLNVLKGTRGRDLSNEWKNIPISTLGSRLACTLGADPEIFVVDKDGKVIPAWTFLPAKASKAQAYWDGFQAEFTTRADGCFSWVADSTHVGLKTIHQAAKKVGGKLTIDTVLPVDPDFLQTAAQEHVQFGCMPSFNAYGMQGNKEDGRNVTYRFAGGHMHFGVYDMTYQTEDVKKPTVERYVKALDKVLGVAAVAFLGELDNPIRRHFYGQPGEYRMPKHGFEYRTLSNAWLCHPLVMHMVFDLGRAVCGLELNNLLGGWDCTEDETIRIIMENDVEAARKVLDANKTIFMEILKVTRYYPGSEELGFNAWRNGVSVIVADPRDIAKNWDLDGFWTTHSEGEGNNWGRAVGILKAGGKV